MASYDEHFQAIAQLSDALGSAIFKAANDGIDVTVTVDSYGKPSPDGAMYQKPNIRLSRGIRPSNPTPPLPRGGSSGMR